MKSFSLLSILLTLSLILTTTDSIAQEFPPLDKSPMDAATFPSSYEVKDKVVKIYYSRPRLNRRTLNKLVPNGKVWRTGANEAAEITFYRTVVFGKTKVTPGTYTFYVIPDEDKWTAILSKDLNAWGSYTYSEKNDVVRISAPVSFGEEYIDPFSIMFEKEDRKLLMRLAWGDMRVSFPIQLGKQ